MPSPSSPAGWSGRATGPSSAVIATDPTSFRVKKSGLRGGEVTVPRAAIDEVETGRIELKLSKDEVASAN